MMIDPTQQALDFERLAKELPWRLRTHAITPELRAALAELRPVFEEAVPRTISKLYADASSFPELVPATLSKDFNDVLSEHLFATLLGPHDASYLRGSLTLVDRFRALGIGLHWIMGIHVRALVQIAAPLCERYGVTRAVSLLLNVFAAFFLDVDVLSELYRRRAAEEKPEGMIEEEEQCRLLCQPPLSASTRARRARFFGFAYQDQVVLRDLRGVLLPAIADLGVYFGGLVSRAVPRLSEQARLGERVMDELVVHWSLNLSHPEQGVQVERGARLGELLLRLGFDPTWMTAGTARLLLGFIPSRRSDRETHLQEILALIRIVALDLSHVVDSQLRGLLVRTRRTEGRMQLDEELQIVGMNLKYQRLFCVHSDALMGQRLSEQQPPGVVALARRVLRDGRMLTEVFELPSPSGARRCRVRAKPILDLEGVAVLLQFFPDDGEDPPTTDLHIEPRIQLALDAFDGVFWEAELGSFAVRTVIGAQVALGHADAWIMQQPDGWLQLIHPEDRAAFEKALAGRGRRRVSARMLDVEGHWVRTQHWLNTVRTANGPEVVGVFADERGERKAAEDREAFAQRYQQLFEALPLAVFELDLSELRMQLESSGRLGRVLSADEVRALMPMVRIRDVNAATVRMLGLQSKAEVVSRRGAAPQPSWFGFLGRALSRVAKGERSVSGEAEWSSWDSDRVVRFLANFAVVTGNEQDWRRVLITMQDISQLRDREKELRLIQTSIEAAPQPICQVDAEGRTVYANPAQRALYGISKEEALKSHAWDFNPARTPENWSELVKRVEQEGAVSFEAVHRRPKSGEEFPVRVRVHRVPFEDTAYFTGFIEDLTEPRRLALQQEELREQLRLAAQMEAVGHMTGGIAHDFNNIVTAVLGHVDFVLAEENSGTDAARESVVEIQRAALRAREMIQGILDSGTPKPVDHREPTELAPLIIETARLFERSIPARVRLSLNIEDELPLVQIEGSRIHRVLLNLCGNAVQAIGAVDGRVEIEAARASEAELRAQDLSGAYLRLSVVDDGPGMDAHTKARVFEPFFTTRAGNGGTGLGLATVAEVVRRHGGALKLSTAPGEGARFDLYLPVSKVQTLGQVEEALPRGNERILWVDDDPAIVRFGDRVLRRLGYRVTSTTDSREALRLMHDAGGDFDLLITDYTMPELNGIDLARSIHDLYPQLPIILCTGYAELQEPDSLPSVGVVAHLLKPWPLRELAQLIRSALAS